MELRRIESVQRIPNELAAIKLLTDSFIHDLERQEYDPEINFSITQGFTEALSTFRHEIKNHAKCITVCYRLDGGWAKSSAMMRQRLRSTPDT
jgi:hypothetical protein